MGYWFVSISGHVNPHKSLSRLMRGDGGGSSSPPLNRDLEPRDRRLDRAGRPVFSACGGRDVQDNADRGADDGDPTRPQLCSDIIRAGVAELRGGLSQDLILAQIQRRDPVHSGVPAARESVPATVSGPPVRPMPFRTATAQSADD